MIRALHLSKSFNLQPVLFDLNFEAKPGEVIALLGANGAGKTTFIRILASLTRPSRGEITLAGFNLPDQAIEARRQVGVVLHQPPVYAHLTAEENLRFYGRLFRVENLEMRIDEMLDLAGLSRRRKERTAIYSRGMLQRLAIARAALHNPPIYLLDEPQSGLDPDASARLEELIQRLAGRGALVLFTTHELQRASAIATRFDILHHGKIAASRLRCDMATGGLEDFYRQVLAK